jgi:hypothetical protein
LPAVNPVKTWPTYNILLTIGLIIVIIGSILSVLSIHFFMRNLYEQNTIFEHFPVDTTNSILITKDLTKNRQVSLNINTMSGDTLLHNVVSGPKGERISEVDFTKEFSLTLSPSMTGKYSIKITSPSRQPIPTSVFFGQFPINPSSSTTFNAASAGVLFVIIGLPFIFVGVGLKIREILK